MGPLERLAPRAGLGLEEILGTASQARPGQLAFRAPLVHREIQARTDKIDKMDLLGQLALQDLEARMASMDSDIRE